MIHRGLAVGEAKPSSESSNYLTLYYYLCIPDDANDYYYY